MKSVITQKPTILQMILFACFSMWLSQSAWAGPGEEDPVKKDKTRSTKSTSLFARNNSAVRIFPDPVKRTMHVVAKENEGKEVDFFVFDLEGTLLHNYRMKAKDHVKIQGLARGTYVYRVFTGDLETAFGNFEIR